MQDGRSTNMIDIGTGEISKPDQPNTGQMQETMDAIVFEGRNQEYGAFLLRRKYPRHMSRAILWSILCFLLAVNMPRIIDLIQRLLEGKPKEEVVYQSVQLTEIEVERFIPPPPKTKINQPTPPKEQVKFVPPVVKKDEEVEQEVEPPNIEETDVVDVPDTTGVGESGTSENPGTGQEGPSDGPYAIVEQMPQFPNGEVGLIQFLYSRIVYPETARLNRIRGRVIIQFVVSKEGEVQDASIVKGIGGGCEEEALRVVRQMPRWTPGRQHGVAVPVRLTLPINFDLK